MWRPWWRHLGYVLQVWRHLGVQIWCAVIRHLGSISEVFEHEWVAHLSASDPPPPPPRVYHERTAPSWTGLACIVNETQLSPANKDQYRR